MAAFMLESLVLRGVAVRLGALGYLRLGRGGEMAGQAPEIIPSGQPLPNTPSPSVVDSTKGDCPGAGRSRRQAGFFCCRDTARTTTATPAWRLLGGPAPAAAAKRQASMAGFTASVVEVGAMAEILAAPLTQRQQGSR